MKVEKRERDVPDGGEALIWIIERRLPRLVYCLHIGRLRSYCLARRSATPNHTHCHSRSDYFDISDRRCNEEQIMGYFISFGANYRHALMSLKTVHARTRGHVCKFE